MTKIYKKTEQFVESYFKEHGFGIQIKHLKRTVYWVKRLKPDANEALLIAALAHDTGTAYRFKELHKVHKTRGFTDRKILERHQKEGAEIVGEFLKKENANPKIINRVKTLILKHEEGGTVEQNLLKDADSLSFFENDVELFLKNSDKFGKEKVKQKFDWMFNRITSSKAKNIAKKWYEEAIKSLG